MLEKRKIFTKILKSAAFMGIIMLLGIFVKEYSTTIGLFNNIEVQIKGNQFVKDAQIQDQLYPHLTQSLLSLRLNEIQEDVINIDFIETVQVSRVLPHTLLIQHDARFSNNLRISLYSELFKCFSEGYDKSVEPFIPHQ